MAVATGGVVGWSLASSALVGSAAVLSAVPVLPPQATIAALAAPIADSRKKLRRCSFALMDFPP